MKIKRTCARCGNPYKYGDAKNYFNAEMMPYYNYDHLTVDYCGPCAVEALEYDLEDGIYLTNCEKCGREFDPITDDARFHEYASDISLISTWNEDGHGILCADCAIEYLEKYFRDHDV